MVSTAKLLWGVDVASEARLNDRSFPSDADSPGHARPPWLGGGLVKTTRCEYARRLPTSQFTESSSCERPRFAILEGGASGGRSRD